MFSSGITRTVPDVVKLLLLILISFVLFINSDVDDERNPKPDKCHAPIEVLMAQCCILPPFFALDIVRKCGGMYSLINNDEAKNISYRRRHLQGCETWECILRQYKLEAEDGNFDIDGYYTHLDRWVELNSEFEHIMVKAKTSCRDDVEPYLPLELCYFKRVHFCIRRYIELDCPVLKRSDLCAKQKAFYDECREYFIKK